jgi:opacity protein-like surface antigen
LRQYREDTSEAIEGGTMRKRTAGAVAAAAVLLSSGVVQAQASFPFAVEGRAGLALPTGEWNDDDDVGIGWGVGANLQFQVLPLLSLYGGLERYSFSLDSEDPLYEDADADASDFALRAGGLVDLPLPVPGGLGPFVFAGVTYGSTRSSVSESGASITFESDNSVGFEVGGGVAVPVSSLVSLTPALRYRSHSADFRAFDGLEGSETTVSYLSLDLGVRVGR